MTILQTILNNIENHGKLLSQAMTLAEDKILAAETAAESAIENNPLVAQIESAFAALQAQSNAFIAKHTTVTPTTTTAAAPEVTV